MTKQSEYMITGPLFPSILRYTIPVILTSILQLLFNAADLVILGRYCGSVSVGAVGATTSVTNLMVNFFIGLSIGVSVCVANGLGREDEEEVHRSVHTAIPVALLSGVLLTFVGLFVTEPILRLMGTPENVLPLSSVYLRICFAGITFNMVYNYCAAILRAAGDTQSPLIFLSFAGIINVILNVIFVTTFDMNVAGVALATIISQGISAILVLAALMRRQDACRLELRKLGICKTQLSRMLRIGFPAGIQSVIFSLSNVIIQSSINSFGDVLMAGNAAAVNIEGFVFTTLYAFHQTAVNFIGQNAGAKQYKRIFKTLWICLGCVVALGLIFTVVLYVLGPALLSLYITDSQEAIAYGMVRFTYVGMLYFICGVMDCTTGALRGFGESFIPMLISILGVCGVRLAWIYTIFQIPGFHTPQCLYASYPISWAITFFFQLAAFFYVYKRHARE